MRSILVPCIGHPSGGESHRQYSTVHETEVSAAGLSDGSGRADFLELIENKEWIAWILWERFDQSIHGSQRFFAGKDRTFVQTLDVLPGKLSRLVEQQRKLFEICNSTHSVLFVCHYLN